jgi:hypothetical protein
MSNLSGKDGQVTRGGATLADITRWRLATTADNVSYASSATDGYRRRIPGAKHGLGSFSFQLNPADPVTDGINEGDEVILHLHIDATRYYIVPAVIDSVLLAVDISTGNVVAGTADFSTSGAWTRPNYVS